MALIPRIINSFGRSVRKPTFYAFSSKYASTKVAASSESDAGEMLQDEEAVAAAALEAKRNKSRLTPKNFKLLHDQIPVDLSNPYMEYHNTVAFQRRMAARFGSQTGIPLGIAWPTKAELEDMLEYEQVAHPFTLQEMMEAKRKQRQAERESLLQRQKDIEVKVSKLSGWMKELKDRQEKKLAMAKAAQEKKDRLVEEVRQHFGYTVSTKDPRFQEMLVQKEKETKKAEKEAKKKLRVERATNAAKAASPPTSPVSQEPSNKPTD